MIHDDVEFTNSRRWEQGGIKKTDGRSEVSPPFRDNVTT